MYQWLEKKWSLKLLCLKQVCLKQVCLKLPSLKQPSLNQWSLKQIPLEKWQTRLVSIPPSGGYRVDQCDEHEDKLASWDGWLSPLAVSQLGTSPRGHSQIGYFGGGYLRLGEVGDNEVDIGGDRLEHEFMTDWCPPELHSLKN